MKKTFPVLGMSCAACAHSVESKLANTEGVSNVFVNFSAANAIIEWNEDSTNPAKIKESLQNIGYDLAIAETVKELESIKNDTLKQLKSDVIWSGIFSVPILIWSMLFMSHINHGQGPNYTNYILCLLTTLVVVVWGKRFYISAFKHLKHRQANMDTLVAIGTGVAYIFSVFNTIYPEYWVKRGMEPHVYFEAAAIVIFFILLGKLLEEKARNGTNESIVKLMGLQADTAKVLTNGEFKTISLGLVIPGNILIASAGDNIPVDGIVTQGDAYLNESSISGESLPVYKNIGDALFAGTIVEQGSLQFEAKSIGKDTVLGKIVQHVERSQASKANIQQLADRIASVFVPIVLSIACLTLITWLFVGGISMLPIAMITFVSILIIACPCALGLATPTAITAAIGKMASKGILIRDATVIEQTTGITDLVIDKTGTLTVGKPVVVSKTEFNSPTAVDLANVKAIATISNHPFSNAISNFIHSNLIPNVNTIETIRGKGVRGNVNDETYYLGNIDFIQEMTGIHHVPEITETGLSIVVAANSKGLLYVFSIMDQVHPHSKPTIIQLQKMGIQVHMLTGDNEVVAEAVAKETGIAIWKSKCMPADKLEYIKELQLEGKKVAMAGDGINDTQALVEANMSFAMGLGSDIAMATAAITLVQSDIGLLPEAIRIATKTRKIIRQNLFWAFAYNIIGIPLAAGILYPLNGFLLNPMIAGAAMALSSISVVSNSLRIKFIK